MEYKRIEKQNYKLNVINTDRFKTNLITFYFTKEYKDEELVYFDYLSYLITYSSKKYNSKIKLAKYLEELYLCSVFSSTSSKGKNIRFVVDLEYINSKYTEADMDKKSIDLLFEILFNPDVNDGKFTHENFELAKKTLIKKARMREENANIYASDRFRSLFYKETCLEKTYVSVEEYERVTSKEVYEFYKNLINENLIVNLLGDYKDDSVLNYLEDKLNKLENKNKFLDEVYLENKIKNKVLFKEENKDFSQSHLYMGYKFKDLTDFEKHYVAPVTSAIFGNGTNSILFKIVREKNGLCYTINSSVNRFNNSLVVYAGINKKDAIKAIDLIKKCLKDMEKMNLEENLSKVKSLITTSLNTFYDDMGGISEYFYLKNFDNVEAINVRKEKFDKVTVEDVKQLLTKIKLDTIYLLKGEKE